MKRPQRTLLQWSPHDRNDFLTATGTDVRLYHLHEEWRDEEGFGGRTPAENWSSHLEQSRRERGKRAFRPEMVGQCSQKKPIKCLDWCPSNDFPLMVSTGDQQGSVQVLELDNEALNSSSASIKSNYGVVQTFSPKHIRQANAVQWNSRQPNLLVVALDKLRNDHSILVWDLAHSLPEFDSGAGRSSMSQYSASSISTRTQLGSRAAGRVDSKHHFVGGLSEGAVAASWFPEQPNCLAIGTSFKWLRTYDTRVNAADARPPSVVAHSKAVRGTCFDPHRPDVLATFSEDGHIKVWDIRNLNKALVSMTCSKNVLEIAWSPVRPGLLAAVATNEKCINLWNVRRTNENGDPVFIEGLSGHKSKQGGVKSVEVMGIESSSSPAIRPRSEPSQKHRVATNTPARSEGGSKKGQPEDAKQRQVDDGGGGGGGDRGRGGSSSSSNNSTTGSAASSQGEKLEPDGVDVENKLVDAIKTLVLRKPDTRRLTKRTLSSFCWIRPPRVAPHYLTRSTKAVSSLSGSLYAQNLSRVMVVGWNGALDIVSLQDPMPFSLSCQSRVSLGINNALAETSFIAHDPSRAMHARTKIGYSIDAQQNIDIVSMAIQAAQIAAMDGPFATRKLLAPSSHIGEESKESAGGRPGDNTKLSWWKSDESTQNVLNMLDYADASLDRENLVRLRDMWRWIKRASTLVAGQPKGLIEAGLVSILSRRTSSQGETRADTRLRPRFELYRSHQRNLALALCGWRDFKTAEFKDAENVAASTNMLFSESDVKSSAVRAASTSRYSISGDDSDYQRLAALAVFYCDLTSAVRILQDAAEQIRQQQQAHTTAHDEPEDAGQPTLKIRAEIAGRLRANRLSSASQASLLDSSQRAAVPDLLQLVAMAFAGYPDSAGVTDGCALWLATCRQLLARLVNFPVLRSCLEFLVENFLRRQQNHKTSNASVGESTGSGAISSSTNAADDALPSTSSSSAASASKGAEHEEAREDKHSHDKSVAINETTTLQQPQQPQALQQQQQQQQQETTGTEDQYFKCVTEEPAIALGDKIAFACRFLPDNQLYNFVVACCEKATLEGHLDGIILTGLGEYGLRLIQAYVDRTGDVQTAALVSCHTIRKNLVLADAERVNRWVVVYRELLNTWQLWQKRAHFDVLLADRQRMRSQAYRQNAPGDLTNGSKSSPLAGSTDPAASGSKLGSSPESSSTGQGAANQETSEYDELLSWAAKGPQLYVVCTHCKESLVLADLLESISSKQVAGKANKRKLTLPSCPRCGKRLSSCAVCTLPMTSLNPYAQMAGLNTRDRIRLNKLADTNPATKVGGKGQTKAVNRLGVPVSTAKPFGKWFSWCLRCRHGGHAACMLDWFSSHSTCPSPDCNCRCTAI